MSRSPVSDSHYYVGGSLPVNALTYVRRQADRELYESLKQGEFCYVLNARQMGKSSLRVQVMQQLQQEGYACAAIDITSIGTATITPEQWYAGVINNLINGFNLEHSFILSDWWPKHGLLSPVQRLSIFIESVLLISIPAPIIIFIDEIDSVLSLQFNLDDFFALIRDCYNRRADQPAYRRLCFTLIGVSTPSDLIQDRRRTPFNVGRAIDLTGFQLEEAEPLATGLVTIGDFQSLMQAVLDWTGGQPFLTQKVCKLLIQGSKRFDSKIQNLETKTADWVGIVVRQQVIENWEAQDEPEHLKTIRNRILFNNDNQAGRLLGLCQQIVQQGYVIADDSPEQIMLRLTGLVVKRQGKLRIYNQIYQAIFNQDWVERELAKLRPYAESLDAWITSNRQDESRLLWGQALEDAQNWAMGKSLANLDYQYLALSQKLNQEQLRDRLEREKEEQRQRELEALRKLARQETQARKAAQNRIRTVIISSALVLVLAIFATFQWRNAEIANIYAIQRASDAFFVSNNHLDSLIEAVRAWKKSQMIGGVDAKTQSQVDSVLRQAIYGAVEYNRLSLDLDEVKSVAFSPDGHTIASTGRDKTIKLWKRDGTLITLLKAHSDRGWQVVFSPDGQMLASCSTDKTIKLWKLEAGKTPVLFKTLSGHRDGVRGVAFSPDGQTLASASDDKTVKLWKQDGTLITTLADHTGVVNGVAFSPDGQMLASASDDKTVKLWKQDGTLITTLNSHNDIVNGVAFSPDGQMLASTSWDKTVKLWNLEAGKMPSLVTTLTDHHEVVSGVVFSPDSQTFASSSWDKTVKLWKRDGTLITSLEGHGDRVWSVAFSPDGKTLASASDDKTVKLWRLESSLQARLAGHSGVVIGVAFSPDGKTLASASDDKTVKLWKRDGTLTATLSGHTAQAYGVAFSPDGQTVASTSADNTVKLWNLGRGQLGLLATLKGHESVVWSVAFSPDGQTVASASWDKTVKLWNIGQGAPKLLATLKGHQAAVLGVTFSPDGKTIASTSADNTIKLWRMKPNQIPVLLKTLLGHATQVYGVAFSPDGRTIASASADNTVKLWNLNGNLLRTFNGHSGVVFSIAFSPDGQTIASASWDKTVKLWKPDGTLLATLNGYRGRFWGIAFSSDSQTIASANEDKSIILWNKKKILTLNPLMYACNWIHDYLKTNPTVSDNDHHLCN